MAGRRSVQAQKNSSVRRGFLFLFIVAVLGVAFWRWGGNLIHRGQHRESGTAIMKVSDPVITPPKDEGQAEESLPAPDVAAEDTKTVERDSAPAVVTPAAVVEPEPVAAEPEPVTAVAENPADKDFQEGVSAFKGGDFIKARASLSRAVEIGLDEQRDRQARELLNKAADQWLFSRNVFDNDPYCELYKVASGDLLVKIGKRNEVPYEFLMKINGIKNASKLQVGQVIKLVHGPFHCVVELCKFRMSVYLGNVLVRTYDVSIGAPGRATPTGLWVVQVGKKQINPAWPDSETGKYYYPDDPANPLGERWIGLQGLEGDAVGRDGFGIHGTIKPEEIGKAASRGCIRLLNAEVEELYDMLQEGKSQVRVVN